MNKNKKEPIEIRETDILFDCPHCGKSLAIDEKGVGLTIHCPDCNQAVQVPARTEDIPEISPDGGTPQSEKHQELQVALAASQERVRALSMELQDLRQRRAMLEDWRTENLAKMEHIRRQLDGMRDALVRLMDELL